VRVQVVVKHIHINALLGFDYFREDYTTHKSYIEDLKPAKVNKIVTIISTNKLHLENQR